MSEIGHRRFAAGGGAPTGRHDRTAPQDDRELTMPELCLVSMPWQSLARPSLQVGVLTAACVRAGLPAPSSFHGDLAFAGHLLERSGGALTPAHYEEVAENGFVHALGDWIFTHTLHGNDFGIRQMAEYAKEWQVDLRIATRMREHAEEFVDIAVSKILDMNTDIVGFSSTFMQNVPSLAVARRIKRRSPRTLVLFGGGNCDGPMGAALHREFPFVDLVLSGEADENLPLLLRALDSGGLGEVPGLIWRQHGEQRINPPGRLVPPAAIGSPDYDAWFGEFDRSAVSEHLTPQLVLESSRGCWWGERHQCTFCGLNGTGMPYRSKPGPVFLGELEQAVTRHQVLDVVMVDNILDPRFTRTVLPAIAARDWDLNVHYEVKSNLTAAQIATLAAAGIHSVQPGIESLIDDVLRRMDKGVPAARNIRTLRDCHTEGLSVSWNWLYGFPGEQEPDLTTVLETLPALVHLPPPSGANRIQLHRFSPHFTNPELGFRDHRPARAYACVYDLPPERMADLVYAFDTPDQGLTDAQAEPLHGAIARWRDHHPASALTQSRQEDTILIIDRRAGFPAADHRIRRPEHLAVWRELQHGRSLPALTRATGVVADDWLAELREAGLVCVAGDRWLALPTGHLAGYHP
ncbi:RiPP maturation radical SAM protein 1 [Pseudonocardiaceae bacterium YIM PH 21723]|nr:RiPP maturation radical SAM protein 1 [Pseudonocardiaceae bacterium YIM PH 21723]